MPHYGPGGPTVRLVSDLSFLSGTLSRQDPPSPALAFVFRLELFLQEVGLPVAQDEGEEGQDEGVENTDDGQDVGPAHRAVPQGVLAGPGPAHVPNGLRVPAVGEYHAAQNKAQSLEGGKRRRLDHKLVVEPGICLPVGCQPAGEGPLQPQFQGPQREAFSPARLDLPRETANPA